MKKILPILILSLCLIRNSVSAQNALDFDGTDDKIDCGNDTSVNIAGTKITLEAWIYPTAWKTNVYDGNVICKEYNTSNYGYMLRVGASGKLNFAIGNGTWNELTSAGTVLKLNTWQHIAGTYDGSFMRIYVDGSIVDSSRVSISITNSSAVNLILGGHSSYTRFYQGMIDEVRVWAVCRTRAELRTAMNEEFCKGQTGLRAYYKFNQGKASGNNLNVKTLADLSRYGNTGTLSAFALTSSASNWVKGQSLNRAAFNTSETVEKCDRFFAPSGKRNWNKSGIYYDTLPTYMGCDSIIKFNLTIKKSTSSTIRVHACSSYTSPSGIYTWTKAGTYTDYIFNSIKCDSVITIILTIGGSRDTIYPLECESYTSPSGKYTWSKSGTYYDTIQNYRKCDSVLMINLKILGPTYAGIKAGYCDFYKSPSGKYIFSSEGVYQDTIKNHLGCDSVLTIQLSYLGTKASVKAKACNQYRSASGKYTWAQSGNYSDTVKNKAGCDSVISVELTILKTTYASLNLQECRMYISPGRKRIFTKSAVFNDTLKNAAGCDSVITINLSIIKPSVGVSQSGPVLTALQTGASYQWLDCGSFMNPVSGETAITFAPSKNGNYAVEINLTGCKDTSACYLITSVGMNRPVQSGFGIVPNPAKGVFAITSAGEQAEILIYSLDGQLIQQFRQTSERQVFRLEKPAGMYRVLRKSESGVHHAMLIISE